MRWITDNLKRAAWLIGAALAVTVLTAIGADVVQLGLDVIGPNATTKNARAIVFTGSGVSTNTTAGGTNTVTISGGSGITTAVSTNLAAGVPTVVGSELRVGTNVTAGITLRGYESTITPSDIFGWYSGGSIANSNNAVPVYWSSTVANGNYLGLGFTSGDSLLQSRYAFAIPKIPSYASGWNSGTGMVVSVYTSTNAASFTALDFRLTSPNGTQFSTNNLTSSANNTLTHFYIPGSSLPGFSNNTDVADWTIRLDFKCKSSMTAAVSRVKFQFQ